MTLIDHTEEWLSMMNALNSTEDGEVSEEAEALMIEIEKNLSSKIDGCVMFMDNLRINRTVCLDMEDKYKAKAEAWNKKMEWMKSRVLSCMHRMGQKTLETALHKITIAANGGVQGVEITADEIPREYVKIKETATPDLDRMRKELQAGKELPFAKLKEKGCHLRIS